MQKTPPHIAILPSPGMSHFIPMFEFAKRLTLQHNFSTTLVIPHYSGPHLDKQNAFLLQQLPKGMNYTLLPPPNFSAFEANLDFKLRCCLTISKSVQSIRDVIKSLMKTQNLVALVVDLFGTQAFDVANELNISPYMFFPSTAMALSSFFFAIELDATVSCEYRDFPEPIRIPGCIPIHGKDLPEPFHLDRESIGYKYFRDDIKRYKMAEGIIVNTFNEMEAGAMKALHDKQLENPPIYSVGPLVQTTRSIENSECMKWLGDQPVGSILFICFGSLGLLSRAQIHELALGIEMSEKGFLWVVRSPNDDPSGFLPEGFVERTKQRGFLVSNWAPQAKILSHASTGGFLTHCGWNSVLESVVNSVPMIAWPLFAEQKMNAAMLSEDLKIALRLDANNNIEDGLVGKVAIANFVKDLMDGEEGKQLRKKTMELKDAAAKVLGEDGSSTKSVFHFSCMLKNKI
ncbi:hypothetical protein ACH5RR_024173 [Cinchona calisaya]|uniref:Glycosyltransferase n=1 Tax=Cinchona calisaya TaxID=153742 RepID=A0ABD2ZEJ8_9GENT